MQKTKSAHKGLKTPVTKSSLPLHYVHFYKSQMDLIRSLADFISSGIRARENCLVIATLTHIEALDVALLRMGINISEASRLGAYRAYDAAETLNKFMVNGNPDRESFFNTIGRLVEETAQKGQPVRAFGEMVALLWKVGNHRAVIELEDLWNELSERNALSLYCAYPELHFVMDKEVRDEITTCHSATMPLLSFSQ